jgi:SAM-dependent methyltransferase
VTLLAEDPDLWDAVFPESAARARFVGRLARRIGPRVLDVGCATGSLCALLQCQGFDPVGVDKNRRFIAAARRKDADGTYVVGDMRTFRLERKFDVIVCLGTTFSYNYTNAAIRACLQNLKRHLSSGGRVVIDVLNAIAFIGPRPFQRRTQHYLWYRGKRTTATIRHQLDLRRQLMTEQVTWSFAGQTAHRDPPEKLRLFFPQEFAFHLEQAGFGDVKLIDTFGKSTAAFDGRRLIAVAAPQRSQ